MAITGQQLVDRAHRVLLDLTGVKFPDAELLLWLGDAMRQIVLVRPDANPTIGDFTLTINVVQYALPAGGLRLLASLYNGTVAAPGDAISIIHRSVMDNNDRTWFVSTAAATVKHIVYDDRFPKVFWVYPRPNGANHIAISYASAPADIAIGSNIPLSEDYQAAILDWMLYRSLCKIGPDMKDAALGNPELAVQYHQHFFRDMRAAAAIDLTMSPNWASYPRNPQGSPLTGAAGQKAG